MKLFHFNGSTVNIEDQKKKKRKKVEFLLSLFHFNLSICRRKEKKLCKMKILCEKDFFNYKNFTERNISSTRLRLRRFFNFSNSFFLSHFNELESFSQSAAGFMFTSYSLQFADSNDDWLKLLAEGRRFFCRAAKFSMYQKQKLSFLF